MAAFPERRTSKAAEWSRRLSAFALTLFLVAGLSHRYNLLDTVPFFWVLGIVGTLTIVALGLSAYGFYRLWNYGERAGQDALIGLVIGLIAAAPFAISAYRVVTLPRLHDISTDLTDPPAMPEAAKNRTAEMNAVGPISAADVARQQEGYPLVTGRRYAAPSDRVFESIVTLTAERGWRMYRIASPPAEGAEITIEAAAGSYLLNLPADVAIRLTDEETSSYVDMRSSSRYGLHDFGDNAARILRFLTDLDAVVAAQVAPPDAEEPAPGEAAPPAAPPVPSEPPAGDAPTADTTTPEG
jgi:hypothetical protein